MGAGAGCVTRPSLAQSSQCLRNSPSTAVFHWSPEQSHAGITAEAGIADLGHAAAAFSLREISDDSIEMKQITLETSSAILGCESGLASAGDSLASQMAGLGIRVNRSMQVALEAAPPSVLTASAPRLRIRQPVEAEVTEADMLRLLEEAQLREKSRLAAAWMGQSANDVPYPVPLVHEACAIMRQLGGPTAQLLSFYASLGTWDVPPSLLHEVLELRAAAPLQLEVYNDKCAEEAAEALSQGSVDDLEEKATQRIECGRIIATKMAERHVWGCFNDAPFPLDLSFMFQGLGEVLPVDRASLRSSVHADSSVMITEVAPASPAWATMLGDEVSHWAREPDVRSRDLSNFEQYASGGFCLRVTTEMEQFQAFEAPDEWVCVICLDETKEGAVLANCGHSFHSRCISKWFCRSSRCPLCRCKSRVGPAVVNSPMEFEVESWPMLPDGVIACDAASQVQERVADVRRARPLGTAEVSARRERLAARFGCEMPSPSFFHELPADEGSTGPAVVLERSHRCRQEGEAKFRELEISGSEVVAWPVDGRWPALPVGAQAAKNHAALTRRLALHLTIHSDSAAAARRSHSDSATGATPSLQEASDLTCEGTVDEEKPSYDARSNATLAGSLRRGKPGVENATS